MQGYGRSDGYPTEKGIYNDGQTVYDYVVNKLDYKPDNIVLLGRSLGSTVAVDVASHNNIGRLILVSPVSSGKEVAKITPFSPISFIALNCFDNKSKIKKVNCPVMIIHGKNDRTIPIVMGQSLYEEAELPKKMVDVDSANHIDLSTTYKQKYLKEIVGFMR